METANISYYPVDYNLAPNNGLTKRLNIAAVVVSVVSVLVYVTTYKDVYWPLGAVAVIIILYGQAKSSSYGMLSFSEQGLRLTQKGKADISFAANDIHSISMNIYKEERVERYGSNYFIDVVVMKLLAGNQQIERQFELSPNNLDEQVLLTEQMVQELTDSFGSDKVLVVSNTGFAPMPDNVSDNRYYIWILVGTYLLLSALYYLF